MSDVMVARNDMKARDYVFWISVLYLVLTIYSAATQEIASDEPFHLSAGYSKLATGDFRMHTESPPVIDIIEAYPLYVFTGLESKTNTEAWQKKDMIQYSYEFVYENNLSPQTIVLIGRLPMIFLGLLLGMFIFYFTKTRYGTTIASLTYLIYATHPSIVSQAATAYADFGFMLFNFFTFFILMEFFRTKKEPYLYGFIIMFSLTFLTKFTSIHNFLLYIILFAYNWKNIKSFFKKNNIWKYVAILIISLYIMVLVWYNFENMFLTLEQGLKYDPHIDKDTNKKYLMAEEIMNKNTLTKAIASIPIPLPYYFIKGIGFWVFDNRTTVSYLSIFELIWAIVVKTPLILLVLLTLSFVKKKEEFDWNSNFIIYVVYFILIFGLFGHYTLPRYLLCIYPFLILIGSKGISEMKINKEISYKTKFGYILLAIAILEGCLNLIYGISLRDYVNPLHNFHNIENDFPEFLRNFGFK